VIDPKSPVGDPNAVFPLDRCFGHPYLNQYHYHGPSWACFSSIPKLKKALDNAHAQSPLLGYAIDGFGIYGPRGPGGKVLANKDLDECHGRTSKVWWDGKYVKMYHYVLSAQFPYSIGCFRAPRSRCRRSSAEVSRRAVGALGPEPRRPPGSGHA